MSMLRSHRGVTAILVGVAVVVVSAIAWASTTAPIPANPLDGQVTILESQFARFDRQVHTGLAVGIQRGGPDATLCSALGTAVDIGPRQSVVVSDEDGAVLGLGEIGSAMLADGDAGSAADTTVCSYPFHIDDVRRSSIMTIQIGSQQRATFAASELDRKGWNVVLLAGS